jgi:hypothetical protein
MEKVVEELTQKAYAYQLRRSYLVGVVYNADNLAVVNRFPTMESYTTRTDRRYLATMDVGPVWYEAILPNSLMNEAPMMVSNDHFTIQANDESEGEVLQARTKMINRIDILDNVYTQFMIFELTKGSTIAINTGYVYTIHMNQRCFCFRS